MTLTVDPTWSRTKLRRKRALAQATRDHRVLIALLCLPDEPHCSWCKRGWDETHLQIDHMDGRAVAVNNAAMRNKRWDVRVRRYWWEYLHWVSLRVLCKECNSRDGRARQLALEELPDAPF